MLEKNKYGHLAAPTFQWSVSVCERNPFFLKKNKTIGNFYTLALFTFEAMVLWGAIFCEKVHQCIDTHFIEELIKIYILWF